MKAVIRPCVRFGSEGDTCSAQAPVAVGQKRTPALQKQKDRLTAVSPKLKIGTLGHAYLCFDPPLLILFAPRLVDLVPFVDVPVAFEAAPATGCDFMTPPIPLDGPALAETVPVHLPLPVHVTVPPPDPAQP